MKPIGVTGITGVTAYVGMLDLGKPKQGETVVVSTAAGATGSVAAQLAKLRGARVIGVAGGTEKWTAHRRAVRPAPQPGEKRRGQREFEPASHVSPPSRGAGSRRDAASARGGTAGLSRPLHAGEST